MSTRVSIHKQNDYLLLIAEGEVFNSHQYQELSESYLEKILEHNSRIIIIDESKVIYSPSLLLQSDIIDFYDESLPAVIKEWTVAIVMDDSQMSIGEFWQYAANEAGYNYRVFYSMNKAIEYIRQQSPVS